MTSTIKKPVEFIKVAPVVVVVSREVNASAEASWDTIADTPGWVDWFPNLKSAEYTSNREPGVGATRRVKVGPLTVDEEFIVWDRPRAWGFTFLETNLPWARAGVELAEIEAIGLNRSRITYTMAVDLRGPLFFRKIFVPVTKRTVGKSLDSFAAHVEGKRASE